MSEQIKTLKRQCASIKAQLTRVKNALTDSMEPATVNVRKSKIAELYDNFHSVIIQLESLDESSDYQSQIIEFEDSYYTCAEALEKLQMSNVQSSGILPKIKLRPFDGNLIEWQSFHDSFLSMVHENKDLLDVQKFHYLKHSLHGEIASVIDTLNASKENYLVAWALLVKRCTQPRRIIHAHLKSLFELPSLTHDDPIALRSLINATEKHVNALKAISVPVNSWNEILTYIVTSKLDKTTRREWDRSLNDEDLPKLDDLLTFLVKFSRDDAAQQVKDPCETVRAKLPARANNKVANQERSFRSGQHSYVSTQEKIVKCQLCSNSHNIQNCERFLSLSVNDRFKVAKDAKLCINCLRAGHSCNKCYGGSCRKCQRKHHTLLHRSEDVNNSLASNSCIAPTEQSHTSLTASIPSEVLLSTMTKSQNFGNLRSVLQVKLLLKRKNYVRLIFENIQVAIPQDVMSTDGYYLPHHPVFKQSSLTTKLRVVFDASAATSNGLFLNDVLLVGPTIQDDLFSLIIRFRLHNYVLTADIEKMYRQVLVQQDDAAYQKILWRENINEQIKIFRLDTVTYGTASASFLAIRALHQLVQDEGTHYPLASKSIINDFYVDDLLTGASTYEEAVKLRDELLKLTSKAKFHLRQWASNEPTLLKGLVDKSSKDTHEINSNSIIKALGVLWNSSTDVITYSTNINTNNSQVTKWIILSSTAQLFDPLGLLGPVIVKAKMIMQDLWKRQQKFNFMDFATIVKRLTVPVYIFVLDNQMPIVYQGYKTLHKRVIGDMSFMVTSTRRNMAIVTNSFNKRARITDNYYIDILQHEQFKKEIDTLNSGKALDKRSKILNLNPFLDERGILRVGGRLHHSHLEYNQKHPILLPRAHRVTKLIIREHHIKNYHSGVQSTLNAVRERCQRARLSDINYIMGNLPKNRIQQSRPFEIVGIDYCGPLFVKV
ncbi:uncharacterized protein LOC143219699 [Lasioglossum baleicum]|uniref:uncharacterized protein LOC143219699 n=1 Tax=Lasioglossum baleicum TaxID=434251 RepID=UPI003FCD3A1E